jgi:hypothetical protein
MTPPAVRLLLSAAAALALSGAAAPAAAQVQGPCTAWLNGVAVERLDSLSSPLLLGDDEALIFSGTDATGTQNAEVAVLVGPATIAHAATSSGVAGGEFLVSLDLADAAPYGVGLLRVRATTDNCTVEAWLRVGGRLPFTTLVGLTGIGLAVAGLTGQISALIARRRWSPPAAAAAGVATGAGLAMLGQELGRLQLSYLTLGAAVALAVAVGLGLALLLRPHRGGETEEAPDEDDAGRPPAFVAGPRQPEPAPAPRAAARQPEPAIPVATPATAPRPVAAGPFWCYVMADTEVLHLDDYSRVVAVLQPGTWYLAKREVSGWAQVVGADGTEGWVPRQTLHREG